MELASLPHDTARRFATLMALVRLAAPEGGRLLDIGGYPGTFGRVLHANDPRWRVETVDTKQDTLENYHVASGARLPFDDKAFDVVVSSDTLEHVPQADRAAFIAEACRVASGPVLIGAPFEHPAVAEIEAQLDEAHRQVAGKPHPWLAEHRENELPKLRKVLAMFPSQRTQALVAAAPLLDWAAWQWGSIARQVDGGLDDAWKAYDGETAASVPASPHDNAEFEIVRGSHGPRMLPYRWVIVSQPRNTAILAAPAPDWEMPAHTTEAARAVAFSRWMRAMETARAAGGASAAEGINQSLAQALKGAEEELARLREENQRLRSAKGWRGLFRRRP